MAQIPRCPSTTRYKKVARVHRRLVFARGYTRGKQGVRWLWRVRNSRSVSSIERRAGGGTNRRRAGSKSVDTRCLALLPSRLRRGSRYRPLGDQA